jgi:UDP-N-acetylmuramoyl-tripeptide--D-alanyl-D-alanine ligase
MKPLWTRDDVAQACGGTGSGAQNIYSVTFDSREVEHGSLFIALKGEQTDGHRFLPQAFKSGAVAALVSEPCAEAHILETSAEAHILVPDTFMALQSLAAAARSRMHGKVIGVTGSVGKTSTKEALAAALQAATTAHVHKSVKSYNNHTGVPLSLARMPQDSGYGVFEMGMSHAGELAALTQMVRPHVALVTAIASAHRAHFATEADIAHAKAEIFAGLEAGGTAIIPYDTPHYDILHKAAVAHAAKVVSFGRKEGADIRIVEEEKNMEGSEIVVQFPDKALFFQLKQKGTHWVSNAVAVLAVVDALGLDVHAALKGFEALPAMTGRGERTEIALPRGSYFTLIDESYNANPASMAATIAMLGEEKAPQRIAILGEMRELGASSAELHAALVPVLIEQKLDAAILVGAELAPLIGMLQPHILAELVPDALAAAELAHSLIKPGAAVLVKGSNALGLAKTVALLKGH